jgi:hypothetical protein
VKPLKWLAASLIGLLGAVVALLGAVLTVTLVLAPVGIPLLLLARRLFGASGRLVVPRAVRHPLDELDRAGTDKVADLKDAVGSRTRRAARSGRKAATAAAEQVPGRSRRRLRDRIPGL